MANIVLFHSVLGLRQSVLDTAASLQKAGHRVFTPDLFEGQVFNDVSAANKNLQEIGMPNLISRAMTSVAQLPSDLVYSGFSMGGLPAEILAAKRPGAKGCLLFHSAQPLETLKIEAWPANVPVQVHFGANDPWRNIASIQSLEISVRLSGSAFEYLEYDTSSHLFCDAEIPGYDPVSEQLLLKHVIAFLEKL